MNALEIIQQASTILGFPMPITLENPQDTNTMRLLSCLNRALEDIVRQHKWQAGEFVSHFDGKSKAEIVATCIPPPYNLIGEKPFEGYEITKATDAGFTGLLNNYVYNTRRKQYIKAVPANEYLDHYTSELKTSIPIFTLFQNHLCFSPKLKITDNITLLYRSNYVVNTVEYEEAEEEEEEEEVRRNSGPTFLEIEEMKASERNKLKREREKQEEQENEKERKEREKQEEQENEKERKEREEEEENKRREKEWFSGKWQNNTHETYKDSK